MKQTSDVMVTFIYQLCVLAGLVSK